MTQFRIEIIETKTKKQELVRKNRKITNGFQFRMDSDPLAFFRLTSNYVRMALGQNVSQLRTEKTWQRIGSMALFTAWRIFGRNSRHSIEDIAAHQRPAVRVQAGYD